jgi:hypothetical protein
MRLIMVVLVAAAIGVAGPALVGDGSTGPLLAQVETPEVDPAETNPAAWASLIWIAVGLIFLILLVGAILLGVRSTGDRPPMWRRRTRE